MTAPDNPYFARAMANWVWAQFFGKGLADPPDDLSRSNPPVHPELLDALARHFVAHQYDLRDLIRTIATSEAYHAVVEHRAGQREGHPALLAPDPPPLDRAPDGRRPGAGDRRGQPLSQPRRGHAGDRRQRPGHGEHDPRHLRPLPADQRLRLGRHARP